MLCLSEGTPVIMALCLIGSVLLIVGGSMWGSGEALPDENKKVTGIVLFAVSLFLLVLGAVGCICNQYFCTVDRKSRIAMRLYGTRPPLPAPDGEDDGGSSFMAASDRSQSKDRVGDEDWQEYAGSRASFKSFRSGRNSTRNLRSRTSLRQDRVLPNEQPVATWSSNGKSAAAARPLPPTPTQTLPSSESPPPQPPRYILPKHIPQTNYNFNGNSNGGTPVPVEFSGAPASLKTSGGSSVNSLGYFAQRHSNGGVGSGGRGSQQDDDDGFQQYRQEHQRRQQTQLIVRPHLSLTPSHSAGGKDTPSRTPQTGDSAVIIGYPVVI